MVPAPETVQTDLPGSITTFGRFLRAGGIGVGVGEIVSAVQAVELVGVERKQEFKWALRGTLVKQHGQIPFFDWAFEIFWQNPDRMQQAASALERLAAQAAMEHVHGDRGLGNKAPSGRSAAPGLPGDAPEIFDDDERDEMPAYSAAESLKRKRFEEYTADELRQALYILKRSDWSLGLRRTRRLREGHRRYRLSLPKTIRKNVLTNRDFVQLAWQERKLKPRRMVVLCDISGSMERYTRVLLHFMHTLKRRIPNLEAFTFGTRLSRITNHLKQNDVQLAVEAIGPQVQDWDGGTRIGAALKDFNFNWARRTLGSGAVVLVISDGWDTGEPELLAVEIARLRRSCRRLIWLNPNLGYETYEPLTRGIQDILPYIDDFLPVHNLQSLLDLQGVLGSLGGRGGSA